MSQLLHLLLAVLLGVLPASAQEREKGAAPIVLSLPNATWSLQIPAMGDAKRRAQAQLATPEAAADFMAAETCFITLVAETQ